MLSFSEYLVWSWLFLPSYLDRRNDNRWLTMLRNASFHTQWTNMASAWFTWQASESITVWSLMLCLCCAGWDVNDFLVCFQSYDAFNSLWSIRCQLGQEDAPKWREPKANTEEQLILNDIQILRQIIDNTKTQSPSSIGRYLYFFENTFQILIVVSIPVKHLPAPACKYISKVCKCKSKPNVSVAT